MLLPVCAVACSVICTWTHLTARSTYLRIPVTSPFERPQKPLKDLLLLDAHKHNHYHRFCMTLINTHTRSSHHGPWISQPLILSHTDTQPLILSHTDTQPLILSRTDTQPLILSHTDTQPLILSQGFSRRVSTSRC
jgi:hypothetical protein